jgi:hypothetical protein
MDELNLKLSFLEKRLERIEEKLNQIPIPFKLMYRPPERSDYVNVVEYLNEIDNRLKQLEDG